MSVPHDVMASVTEIMNGLDRSPFNYDIGKAIEAAILAERQRCSDIAKGVWNQAEFYRNNDMRRAASLIRCRIDTAA